ncbi:hypothetical protein GCM10010439_41150 [Actinocorallia aurantiaca]|uniref:Uncharacterized protein n=1 Tax=Actinocorallia aurantiaca TaxID=46204 RepID=A0ABP6GR67_9ACTN
MHTGEGAVHHPEDAGYDGDRPGLNRAVASGTRVRGRVVDEQDVVAAACTLLERASSAGGGSQAKAAVSSIAMSDSAAAWAS